MPLLPSVIRQAVRTHQATVIFLHGLGDSGEGWYVLANLYIYIY